MPPSPASRPTGFSFGSTGPAALGCLSSVPEEHPPIARKTAADRTRAAASFTNFMRYHPCEIGSNQSLEVHNLTFVRAAHVDEDGVLDGRGNPADGTIAERGDDPVARVGRTRDRPAI